MLFPIRNVLNPCRLKFAVNCCKQFSTSSITFKAMSCVRVPTHGEPRKIKWYTYPVHDSRRCYFPRANETKRIVTHGFEKRMSTQNGRDVLMRRILKGRHVISH